MSISSEQSITENRWIYWLNKYFYWLALGGILVNATGLLLPVLEPDGALYATISKTMLQSGDYVNMKVQGLDWLDKPHFPFWIVALSFKLFGINGFAYKFPAFLFWLTGACYTYIFAKKLYNRHTGQLAALIYLAVEHLIISNNDVRAEPYLTGLVIAAAYYYYRSYKENKWVFILPGSLLLAMAVMTKGIFIPVMVFGGFAIEWMIKKKWKEFINPKWWFAILLLILFISPELISLYLQFDQHPEKTVFGVNHVSGIRFFFWDSQFGRFFNTGPIKGKGDLFFYVHTMLWAFLPWSIFPFLMLAYYLKKIRRKILPHSNSTETDDSTRRSTIFHSDFINAGIFAIGFLLFSLSRFQLPHYLNFLYPFLTILVAHWLVHLENHVYRKILAYTQNIIVIFLFIAAIGLVLMFGMKPAWVLIMILLLTALLIYRLFSGNSLESLIGRSFLAALVINLLLNGFFYPPLFAYQAGISAALFLEKNRHQEPVYTFSELTPEFAFEFYAKQPVYQVKKAGLDTIAHSITLFAPKLEIDSLKMRDFSVGQIRSFPHFHISRITGTFINYKTRSRALDTVMLVTVFPKRKIANGVQH